MKSKYIRSIFDESFNIWTEKCCKIHSGFEDLIKKKEFNFDIDDTVEY